MTEIRDYGDGKIIVLHTDDAQVAKQLYNYDKHTKVVRYTQQQNKKIVTVGLDFYYPIRLRRRLEKWGV